MYNGEGPAEDLVKWYLTMHKYFTTKPTITVAESFVIILECLLEAGSIQNMWSTAVDEAIIFVKEYNRGVQIKLNDKIPKKMLKKWFGLKK